MPKKEHFHPQSYVFSGWTVVPKLSRLVWLFWGNSSPQLCKPKQILPYPYSAQTKPGQLYFTSQ